VVNEDGASITTKVVVKQLCYMPITPRVNRLYLSEETVKQMRWNKEGKHDSEDPDIISHPTDSEAWEALDRSNPEFVRDPGVSALAYRQIVSNLTVRPVVHIIVG
jgi:hypothetical protein